MWKRLLPLVLAAALPDAAQAVTRAQAYAVTTTNQLIAFNTGSPGMIASAVAITGLQPGEDLVGLDRSPLNHVWYGLGSTGRLYRIDVASGAAMQVGSGPFAALSGFAFGFAFNPLSGLIRVVSDFGQNLRLDPDTGTVAMTDGTLNGATSSLVASAHTNSYVGAGTTTLYGIDSQTDALHVQSPPSSGTTVTVGPLGVDVVALAGFDIEPGSGIGYAVLSTPPGSSSQLYTVHLGTGAATLVGVIGGGHVVRAFGLATYALPMVALASGNFLYRFSSATPAVFSTAVTVTGLAPGDNLVAIDSRPATHTLYGLGDSGRLYAIDLSGAAIAVGSPFVLSGTRFGFDVNPVVDRIRVTSDSGQNARVNPNTAAVITDAAVSGAVTGLGDLAYTNSFAGALSTTLYGVGGSTLVEVTNPNGGTTATVGTMPSGPLPHGFDIEPNWNKGFVVRHPVGPFPPQLYEIDLATAALTLMGGLGSFGVLDLAVLDDVIFEDAFE